MEAAFAKLTEFYEEFLDRTLAAARETGAIVTAEEHQVNGGLGGAVSEVIVQSLPVPMEFVGVHDRFGESGDPMELMTAFGLDADAIVSAVQKAMARRK